MARVLVVEDGRELLEAWAAALARAGNAVTTASDGVEAIKQLGTGIVETLT